MRKRCVAGVTAVLLAMGALSPLAGAERKTNAFKTKTKSVAVFKDGYGFFLREGKAQLHDGWCMTDYIPKATAGTFWLYTLEPGTAVNTVRSTSRNRIRFESPKELVEALGRYIGLQVSLRTDETVVEGELLRALDDMILVKSGKQVNVVQVGDVKSAQVLGHPLLIQVEGKKQDDVTLRMGYLQQGINWTPSYTLDIVSPTEARLILRATITNGVEDLTDCDIFFVVGVPNFILRGQLDPLTVHAIGSAVLGGLPPGVAGPSQMFSNAEVARIEEKEDEAVVSSLNVPVEGIQDLYFYQKPGLEIAAGDVAMTTLITSTLPYRSLFTWNADSGKEVDHNIVLKNTLDSPLTTGPVMVVQKGKPVSQDQMRYISSGAEGRLKLTQATDIRTDKTEKEIERRQAELIDRVSYIPVVSEGRLTVENHRAEPAEVEVSWTAPGKVLEASDDADVRSSVRPEAGLNPTSALKCTVRVEAGRKHTVSYRYLRYVRAST